MYEFHGWATIRTTYYGSKEKSVEEAVDNIKKIISGFEWNSGVIDLHAINGEYLLSISGMTNHKGKDAEDVFKLYTCIGDVA